LFTAIRSLTKSYDGTPVLKGLSLDLVPGEIVALLGLNGAGKTTLLRCLAGIAGIDGGEILYDGEHFTRARVDLRRRYALLADSPYFYPEMNVLRHIGMVLRAYGTDTAGIEERIVSLLRDFDLLPFAENALSRLSRGQVYKAALVAVLAVDPELWLLDEPFTSGMDPRGLSALRSEARAASGRGRTILYSTQILEVAERFADRVCILQGGRIHALGTVDELCRLAGKERALEELFAQLHEVAN
jgi:ABC-type multidrug transport system ATPase subunit